MSFLETFFEGAHGANLCLSHRGAHLPMFMMVEGLQRGAHHLELVDKYFICVNKHLVQIELKFILFFASYSPHSLCFCLYRYVYACVFNQRFGLTNTVCCSEVMKSIVYLVKHGNVVYLCDAREGASWCYGLRDVEEMEI